jgi:ribose transport system substrate-binding protein
MRRIKQVSTLLTVISALLILAACSTGSTGSTGSSQSSSGSGANGSSDAATSASVAYAEQQIAADSAVPTFQAPGPPVDVSKAKGKSVVVIPLVANPFTNSIQNTMQYLAGKAGIDYTIYPNQGQESQQLQAFNQALSQKPSLIILSAAPDPREFQPQLRQAKAEGIPVLVTHFYDKSTPPPPACTACAAGVTALETAPFYDAGKAEADWMIADSKGHAHVLIVSSNDILPSPPTVATIENELKAHCPQCTYTDINVPVQDWNTAVGGDIESVLQKNPSINYVDCLYDAMTQTAVPSIQLAGKAGQVKVVSYNGSTFALKYIEDGNIMAMDVGEPTAWIGYAVMDQTFRLLASQKPVTDEYTPIRVWDKSNVSQSGTPPTLTQGYGDAYVAGFNKLWGVTWPGFAG